MFDLQSLALPPPSRNHAPPGPPHANGRLALDRRAEKVSLLYRMEFEFDVAKSRANRDKHGIDFDAARALWDDPDRLEIPARTEDEPRTVVIGHIGGRCWSAIVTERGGRVRIISVRRSRKNEEAWYESQGD